MEIIINLIITMIQAQNWKVLIDKNIFNWVSARKLKCLSSARLGWEPFQLGSAQLGKFQLELITTVSSVEQHVICSALTIPHWPIFRLRVKKLKLCAEPSSYSCLSNKQTCAIILFSKKNTALFVLNSYYRLFIYQFWNLSPEKWIYSLIFVKRVESSALCTYYRLFAY